MPFRYIYTIVRTAKLIRFTLFAKANTLLNGIYIKCIKGFLREVTNKLVFQIISETVISNISHKYS